MSRPSGRREGTGTGQSPQEGPVRTRRRPQECSNCGPPRALQRTQDLLQFSCHSGDNPAAASAPCAGACAIDANAAIASCIAGITQRHRLAVPARTAGRSLRPGKGHTRPAPYGVHRRTTAFCSDARPSSGAVSAATIPRRPGCRGPTPWQPSAPCTTQKGRFCVLQGAFSGVESTLTSCATGGYRGPTPHCSYRGVPSIPRTGLSPAGRRHLHGARQDTTPFIDKRSPLRRLSAPGVIQCPFGSNSRRTSAGITPPPP
jgi:hypothetical protein